MPRGRFSKFVIVALLSSLGCLLGTPVGAEVTATIQEINPNQSSLHPSDPDGASGGRVNGLGSVAGDNTTFYAASERGGLYKSTDTGRTWTRLDRHLPNFTVDVKVDPSNGARVYATSFYDGRVNSLGGINVSTDGGTTWAKPATATPPVGTCSDARRLQPSAFGIAIDPGNPQNVYIGTNCGLAISNTSGATWSFVDPDGVGLASTISDVIVHGGGIIDLCGSQGHWRSTNGGGLWTTAVAGPPLPGGQCSIAASPDEPNVLLATVQSAVWESDDGGSSWTNLGTPDSVQQGRIPFVRVNKRSDGPGGVQLFDLWYGDVRLFRAGCTSNPAGGGLRCPVANAVPLPIPPPPTPAGWAGPFTRSVGGHDDVGDVVFDTTVAVDACPVLLSSDGGVYFNTRSTSPGCHSPAWQQPNVTPHATWLWSMDGADQAGDAAEDLYFGLQDNGSYGATDAGAASPTWTNRDCCDVFDFAAEPARALYTFCCTGPRATVLERRGAGLSGGGAVADPASYPADGLLPGFIFPDILDRFGAAQYVLLSSDCFTFPNGLDDDGDGAIDEGDETQGCTGVNGGDGGVFITTNAGSSPINWIELGNATEPPGGGCAAQAATSAGVPTFYVQSVSCDGSFGGQLRRFVGTNPAGAWAAVNLPSGGVGIFAVDPNNPNRLAASEISGPNSPRMLVTTDGGTTWNSVPELDDRMIGSGAFRYRTLGNDGGLGTYTQPTLFSFDPADSNIMVAGGADSGVFVSADAGEDWHLVTDPIDSGNSGIPHIPRPRYAYFDHEPSNRVNLYVGSEGRGVWRISFFRPPIADADGPYTTLEGTPVTLNGSGSDLDPGALVFAWDFDADGAFDDASGTSPSFNQPQNGVFAVALRVTDSDGAFDTDESTVTVLNVPPTVTAGPDQLVFEDDTAAVTASFTDPGVLDTHTATVDWGDGTPVEPAAVTEGAGNGTVDATHVYPDPGIYTVSITVTDSDGGSGSDTLTVTVVYGFLKYCAFGEGLRDSSFFPDGVKLRREALTDCGLGALRRLRLARGTEVGGDLLRVDSRARIRGEVNGHVRAGYRARLRRPARVTGDVVARGEDIRVDREATLDGDATAGGQVRVRSGGTVTGTISEGAAVPPTPPITLVALTLVSGAGDVALERNETRSLAPGDYGELRARRGATLELAAGHYRFERVRLGRRVTVRLDLSGGAVIVDSAGAFRLKREGKVEISSATGDAADFLIQVGGTRRLRVGRGSELLGTVFGPRARVRLGKESELEGALYGRKVRVGRESEIQGNPAIEVFVALYLP